MPPTEPHGPVSFVMITRDRQVEAVAAVLRALALPERPAVIVVDNGSGDGTVERLRGVPGDLTVIELDRNAGAAGRNVGVALARTPYVAFCDDDSCWAPGSLGLAAQLFDAHPRLGLIAGRVLVGAERREDPACVAMAASPLRPIGGLPGTPVLGFIACGAIVRRDAFRAAGGFDERYGVGGEEAPLAIELADRGWALSYVDGVVAFHHPSDNRDRRRRRRLVTRNRLWLAWGRRHWRSAVRMTAAAVRSAMHDGAARRGVTDALLGAPAVLRERHCVSPSLEGRLRLLDRDAPA